MNLHVALASVSGLLALWIAVYYLWRDFRHDAFREDIFSLRDEMFLYAAQGNISFDHPAYTILRARMNGLLRHGHDLTLTRLIILVAACGTAKSASTSEWEDAIENLPASTTEKMQRFNVRIAIFVLQHVVYYSMFRYMLVRPLMSLVKINDVIESPKVASGVHKLESETLRQDSRPLSEAATA